MDYEQKAQEVLDKALEAYKIGEIARYKNRIVEIQAETESKIKEMNERIEKVKEAKVLPRKESDGLTINSDNVCWQ